MKIVGIGYTGFGSRTMAVMQILEDIQSVGNVKVSSGVCHDDITRIEDNIEARKIMSMKNINIFSEIKTLIPSKPKRKTKKWEAPYKFHK